uniref:Serine/threonine-protein kinase nek2 n=1 Tax=Cucumis melo TaxID=3656 RepID=A0A9I9E9D0_CUCME
MTLGNQARLEAGCSSVPSTEGVINKGKGTHGPTGMSEITRSFIGTTVRVHVSISYQSWKDVPTELKDKIYELIEGGFVVDPKSKKSILQNASVCFRNFKSSLTTKHMVSNKGPERRKNNKYNHRMSQKGYANLTEEMKASTSNGELIDRALVWKKAGTTKNGEIPDIDTKEVANKIDNLLVSKRASHSMDNVTCDILSRAIGGNDPPRRIRGVGQYVTPSKYFYTAREKRK